MPTTYGRQGYVDLEKLAILLANEFAAGTYKVTVSLVLAPRRNS
jgi:hypothetical protein